MSRKWHHNKAWEDEHLVGVLSPVRWVLRLFSSISFAVVLLVFIGSYCALASVPVGLFAMIPTKLVVGATVVLSAAIPAAIGIACVRLAVPARARGARFALMMLVAVGLAGSGVGAWTTYLWPAMRYDPATGAGLRFFPAFVATYQSITLRRMPWLEMTETQFYAAWPMRLALFLFVMNMIVATIRRVEFTFRNAGVLSVHTGIVLIAVGSVYYQSFKQEGDTLLFAGGAPGIVGPPQRAYYDREETVLDVAQHKDEFGILRYEQRPIRTPRYNNYDLRAGLPEGSLFSERENPAHPTGAISAPERAATTDGGRTLDVPVAPGRGRFVDPDIRFRLVGYSPYADLKPDWVDASPVPGVDPSPMQAVDVYADIPGMNVPKDRPLFEFTFFPSDPAQRVRKNTVVGMELTRAMPEQRWDDLRASVPEGTLHALVIEVPEAGLRTVLAVEKGQTINLGDTGWSVTVSDLAPEPPFPIITKGYEGATSSVAIVRIQPPASPASDGVKPEPFDRWVYHRFPEINQDLSSSIDPKSGRPMRGAPDPRIRVSYLDLSLLQVYLDERADGTMRAIVRQPAGSARTFDRIEDGWIRDLVPNTQNARLDLKLGDRWANAVRVERPVPTPTVDRDMSMMGSHQFALLGVEVSLGPDSPAGPWSHVVWLPFTKYLEMEQDRLRTVFLPDGRSVQLAFGRAQRPLPDFSVSLVDFEMIAYDHRGAPRDYQSTVRVEPMAGADGPGAAFRAFDHLIKLNAPLRAPFHWDPAKPYPVNLMRRLAAGLNPDQFKFSQAGWDRAGWMQSQALADQGRLPGPRVNFTILGVGNNPGIHVIALGGVLMGVGIPWAFYVKPWLVRREKRRIAERVRAGTFERPGAVPASAPAAEVSS